MNSAILQVFEVFDALIRLAKSSGHPAETFWYVFWLKLKKTFKKHDWFGLYNTGGILLNPDLAV